MEGLNFAAFISDDRLNATARDDVQIIEQGSEVQYPNYDHIGLQQYPPTETRLCSRQEWAGAPNSSTISRLDFVTMA